MLERELKEYRSLVVQAQSGDGQAYNQLVHRFQDMAVAYAYSVLGDRGWAEDAAQEAFVEAFVCLANLRDPSAFPGWLRRIVFKHCDRLSRKKRLDMVSLTTLAGEEVLEEPESEPHARWESKERAAQVREAVAQLPEHERITIVLFYMGQHSQQHIAQFLEVPLTTVKKRLHSARKRLRQEMIHTMKHDLEALRPSRNVLFAERVRSFTSQFSQKIDAGQSIVRSLSLLAEQEHNADLRQVIAQVQQDITGNGRDGATLSEALAKHPEVFGQSYIESIKRGEINGNLSLVLQQLGRS